MKTVKRFGLALVCCIGLATFIWFWTDPKPNISGTIKIYDRKGRMIFESAGGIGKSEPLEFSDMPDSLKFAAVAVEDRRFWKHHGIDPAAMLRALSTNIRSGRVVSGGSTIPQQLVRFTVIRPYSSAPLTVMRKFREILMAIRLTASLPKEEILERYLNAMHFGRQAYGVGAASRLYFGKDARQLSLAQSAMLAGMIANPTRYDPILHPEEARERRNFVLSNMRNLAMVGEEEYIRAIEEEMPVNVNQPEITAPHVAQMVLSQLDSLNLSGTSGLRVFSTIDLDWYHLALLIAQNQVKILKEKHNLSNAAVVIIENETGEIRALVGSVDYFSEEIEGQNNMALALRQPGSAMKPVTYAVALKERIATAATLIEDVPKVFPTRDGEGFLPHNYDGLYRGPVLLREALASSYNMPAVEMLSRVGIEAFLNLAHDMGITSMQDSDRYDLALTLGGGEVNLLELTNLFATFSRNGEWLPTRLIDHIETDDGRIVYRSEMPKPRKVLEPEVAFLITDILSDSKARIPTFGERSPLVLSSPAAVKTGTTTDWHDNWTVGYTPKYTVGIWVGNADNTPMRELSGVTGAAPIWHLIFEEILKFDTSGGFRVPLGIVEKEVCAWDGLLPTAACSERYIEKFIVGTEPSGYTTLSEEPKNPDLGERIQIINPKQGAVFEVSGQGQERIVFELSPSSKLGDVVWELDGKIMSEVDCEAKTFECRWEPVLGEHRLSAVVTFKGGGRLALSGVRFRVVGYKEGW